jgi:hypothetical protein
LNQPSLRKTRAAVGDVIGVTNQHARMLNALRDAAHATSIQSQQTADLFDQFLGLGLADRLRWLFTGRISNVQIDSDSEASTSGEQVRAE